MSDSEDPAGMANSTRPTSARMGSGPAGPLGAGASSAGSAAGAAGTMALAAAMPSRVTLTQPDVSEPFPGNRPGSSSRKTASHLYMLDLFTLFSEHHSPIAMPDARHRSMRPAHMSRLAASPLTDIPNLRIESVCDNHRTTGVAC